MPAIDPVLRRYVEIAEEQRKHLLVTVTTHGLVVTGTLVSVAEYNRRAPIITGSEELGVQQPVADSSPEYMHLIDVTFVGMGTPPASVIAWRARLADITGWTIGHAEWGFKTTHLGRL